jgi:hypothetical protein
MKATLIASVTMLALMAGTGAAAAQGGQNDVGLKASGNAGGPGGDVVVKGPPRTAGQAVREDSIKSRSTEDLSRNRDHMVVPKRDAGPSGPAINSSR